MRKNINSKKTFKRITFTQDGLEKIKREYKDLKNNRVEAVENLKKARELGDLSENGFYKAARARLSSIDNHLFRMEMMIKLAKVREVSKDEIGTGSRVTLIDGKEERIFEIVGDYEADPLSNKITQNSPLGKALIGRSINDQIEYSTPSGTKTYTIKYIA